MSKLFQSGINYHFYCSVVECPPHHHHPGGLISFSYPALTLIWSVLGPDIAPQGGYNKAQRVGVWTSEWSRNSESLSIVKKGSIKQSHFIYKALKSHPVTPADTQGCLFGFSYPFSSPPFPIPTIFSLQKHSFSPPSAPSFVAGGRLHQVAQESLKVISHPLPQTAHLSWSWACWGRGGRCTCIGRLSICVPLWITADGD